MFGFFSRLLSAEDTSAPLSDTAAAPVVATAEGPFYIEVQVQETGAGPGHVSLTTVHTNQEGEVIESRHTSYTVGGGPSSLINGATLGTIPVPAEMRKDPTEDLRDASVVMRLPVSEESYTRAVAQQQQLEESVENGRCVYSVTGSANPLTSITLSAMENVAEATRQQAAYGVQEDPWGIVVVDDTIRGEKQPSPTVHNCVSAATAVLAAANVDTSDVFHPTGMISALEQQGARPIARENEAEVESPSVGMW